MGFAKEFREFALKGNVMDLAVGVIIGGAFGNIVNALVNDIIMPPISLLIGDRGFSNFYFPVSGPVREAVAANPALPLEEAKKLGAVIAWGDFLTVVINFLILAFVIFLMVKGINRLKRQPEAAPEVPAAPSPQEQLLMDIREELRKQNSGM
jgi:large conductance mechanosensitive channel